MRRIDVPLFPDIDPSEPFDPLHRAMQIANADFPSMLAGLMRRNAEVAKQCQRTSAWASRSIPADVGSPPPSPGHSD